jgi:hypothetical protein
MFSLRRSSFLAAVATVVLIAGCDDPASCSEDPTGPDCGGGDPENISRVTVTLTPVGGGTAVVSVRVDPDGSQLPLPVGAASATLVLHKGVTYNGSIGLLNDINPSDVVDISAEVQAEANFHRFFYSLTCSGVTIPVSSFNQDTQVPPRPLGSTFQLVVDASAATQATCTLNVQLHHFESNKGDGTGSNFETDLDIDFPVSIQP